MTGVRIELITSGSELLNGQALNRHASTLGQALTARGHRLDRDTTVGDDRIDITEALAGALSRADVVILSGGLGPTSDDLTREIVAGIWGSRVVMHEPSRQAVAARYAARNKPLNPFVENHAMVVEAAEVLPNAVGLAPGERLTTPEGHTLLLLPGPPREFAAILHDHVLPWLEVQHPSPFVHIRTVQVLGPGESDILVRMTEAGWFPDPVGVAYCASPGRVLVTFRGEHEPGVEAVCRAFCGLFDPRECLIGSDPLAVVVGRQLTAAGKTVAAAESCTGGGLGAALTGVPGSSVYFRGGIIAYANEIKTSLLGVPEDLLAEHGAVSEPVARAMAEGARERVGADIGVSITGVAGPDGGTPEKPVGLVYIGIADATATEVVKLQAGGDREVIRAWTQQAALNALRIRLG